MTVVTDTDQSLGTRAKVAWNEFAARRLGTGPLTEFTVVEVGVAGPFATCTLADLGAEVVKVEALDSYDAMHEWGRGHYGRSLWWPVQAANKELLTIDLGRENGQELFVELLQPGGRPRRQPPLASNMQRVLDRLPYMIGMKMFLTGGRIDVVMASRWGL